MSVIGVLVTVAALAILITNALRMPMLLAAVVPFAATSAVSVAGQSVVPYHLVAILLLALSGRLLAQAYHRDLGTLPGGRPLFMFCAWAVVITIVSPYVFAGIPVLDPRRGIDTGVKDPSTLGVSISNFAQSGYLVLAVLTVVVIAFHPGPAHRLPAIAFATGTVLSSFKSVLPESIQTRIFDNSSNVSYTAGEVDGVERLRGLFSEPSALGAFSVAAFIYFAVAASRSTGSWRYINIALAVWAFVNAALSYSGGAVVTGVIVGFLILLRGAFIVVGGPRQDLELRCGRGRVRSPDRGTRVACSLELRHHHYPQQGR